MNDWCISRQLWWGQRIPAYYFNGNEFVVANSKEEALEIAKNKFNLSGLTLEDLIQDEDVLDTWFSSWLWPISVFDGIRNPDNEDIKYYYPTNDLVTAPEILFFWVARMIIAGLEYRNDIPFRNVYLTGIVRDKQGRKMSKSLGNSPDPLELIAKYGADGVRVGMLLTSPAGNDLPFDESLCEQGRNFSNKIWNALRLIKGWEIDDKLEQPEYAATSVKWFESKFNFNLNVIEDHFRKYRISDALMTTYKLVWDDFCSWYLEMIKPGYQKPIDAKTYGKTIEFFDQLMRIIHPFMPFISEEIWHHLGERTENQSLMIAEMPKYGMIEQHMLDLFEMEKEVIIAIRNIRKTKNIPQKDSLDLFIKKNNQQPDHTFDSIIAKLCNIGMINYTDEKLTGSLSFIIKSTEFFIPVKNELDNKAEISKLQEELAYTKGFLLSVNKKLENQKFVHSAPKEVVDKENLKKSDAENRITLIENQIKSLEI